ncbi:hypothetical protein [Ochrobactrum sp. EDr1-4]
MGERHIATAIGVQAIKLYHILETENDIFPFKTVLYRKQNEQRKIEI